MSNLPSNLGFMSSLDRYDVEQAERAKLSGRLLRFGINFLDRVLLGILPTDLVLIGAATGIGKTEVATTIAKANVIDGKRVHYFALEAEKNEIERRIKFQLLSMLYQDDAGYKRHFIPNYLEWYLGHYDEDFKRYEEQARTVVKELANLNTYYREGEFNVQMFERIALAISEHTDLIVVDHIHYFDFDDENENKALAETIKKIRDIVLITEVPVILISHLRKKDARRPTLVPDLDDIHGSSNLAKIVTKAIFLSPGEAVGSHQYQTYFRANKVRIDGSRSRYVGRTIYDSSLNMYATKFDFGGLKNNGTEFEIYDKKDPRVPAWLK